MADARRAEKYDDLDHVETEDLLSKAAQQLYAGSRRWLRPCGYRGR